MIAQKNVLVAIVAVVSFIVGILANAYYTKRSEDRIIAALKAELDKLKTARVTPEQQSRILQLESQIAILTK